MFRKLLISLLLSATAFSNVSYALLGLSDINAGTDYQEAIAWTLDTGITSGYGNGMWGPDECVRRAELMKMVMEFNGSSLAITTDLPSQFTDVFRHEWYYAYVTLAHSYGYIEGYADGTFQPNRCVNRAEAMKIAVKVLIGDSLDSSGGPIMYDDKLVSDISIRDWFGPYARMLFKNRLMGTNHTRFSGSISGTNTINFFPGENLSRKEVAEMLYRINQYVAARQ